MTVNYEVKGILAKLLATEDLIVEHKNVETAMFNVHTRVLTLPLWQKATNSVYDMLVGHEVSHALYSSEYDSQKINVPPQFVNVTEDARVEKLIKRRYLGLSKTFYRGYQELHEQDFFSLEDQDVNEMNLADRVNLYFKIGNFIEINFTEKEKEIVDLIAASETFSDAVYAAKVLYEYCKIEQEIQNVENIQQTELINNSSSFSNNQFENDSEESEENQTSQANDLQNQESQTPVQNESKKANNSENNKVEIKTEEALKKSIENLILDNKFGENVYVEIPKVNLDTVVTSNKELHEYIEEYWNHQKEVYDGINIFEESDKKYNNFKISSQTEVNYLLKEFECKKAADSYARSTVSNTGVLDCTKLPSYKFNDDIFKKVTVIPNGKNHGLVFVLDWSGSMCNIILDTIKQLFSLIWFCKKVGIPFEVYAFSSEWYRVKYDEHNKPILPEPHFEKKEGLLFIEDRFSMLQFLNSKVNPKELEKQMKNIWRIAYTVRNSTIYTYPPKLSLSGTPLNEALVSLHQIIPDFKNRTKVQKINCVVLTDGEANFLPYCETATPKYGNTEDQYIRTRYLSHYNCFLRDRKTGNIYKVPREYNQFTGMLLQNLKDNFTSVNFIGIRILEPRDAISFINRYNYDRNETENIIDQWRKNKSFSIKKSGYDKYFGLSSYVLSNEASFEVSECATKTQIKSAFIKSLKTKKMNKKILNEFISLIA